MSRKILSIMILMIVIVSTTIQAYNMTEISIKGFKVGECKAWHEFRKKFNKTYSSFREMHIRKRIFVSNYRKILDHNKLFGTVETFNCSINKFSDLTRSEFVNAHTGFALPEDYNVTNNRKFGLKAVGRGRIAAGQKKIIQEAKVPTMIDWRRTAVSTVKRQSECGSCWALTAVGALEGQIFIKTQKLLNISAQYFLDCVQTNYTFGCDGGLMTDAFKYAMNHSIVSDSDYPYKDRESKYGCPAELPKLPIKVTGFVELLTLSEDELMRAVSTIGPISIAIDARWQSLQFYEFGVYYEPQCSSKELNHAVLVVGYGTDAEFGDFWIIKNSWGISWGEHGYVRLARNRDNHCGVATIPSYPIISTIL